jgi:hypothetical protein
VTDEERTTAVRRLSDVADRLDDLAEIAGLMGDDGGATRWREQAAAQRRIALRLLDQPSDA